MDRRTYLALAAGTVVFGGTLSPPRPPADPRPDRRRDEPEEVPPTDDEPAFQATSLTELTRALTAASSGETVYVPGDVEMDLSGTWMIQVPDGVTLSSDGRLDGPDGALLTSSEGDESPSDQRGLQKIQLGTGARFTGFRLEGHHHDYVNPIQAHDGDFYAHRGSGIDVGTDGVVDNNEISGWVYSAVWAEDNARIRRNHIHHNTWEGLGYGVTIPKGDHMPVIEQNRFNYNRHAISGSGGPECGFVARDNVVGPDWVGAQFDMHGDDGMVGIAGDEIVIRNNDFHATRAVEAKTRNPGGEYPAIQIRGSPETGVWVEENRFVHESREEAYYQTDGPHRVTFDGNTYGWTPEGDWNDPTGNPTNATNQRWWPVDW